MTATLKLVREAFGFELRRGTFHILIDENDEASIEWKQAIEVPIEPGHHTIQIESGRYSSRTHAFDAVDAEIVNFRCSGARIWPLYVVSIFKPDLAISLKRE